MLEAVGLGADEERVYLQLVITFETDPVRLAARLEMAPDDVRRALGALHAKGLVRPTTDPESYTPTPPDVGFGPLLLAQQEALEGARRMVAQLGESYHESLRRRDAGQLVEVITGREALRQQLHDLQLGAREEVVARSASARSAGTG